MSKSYKDLGGVASGVKRIRNDATPKGIIVTTFETLKRRMRRPEFMLKMRKHLSTVIVDEVHLLSGISGGMSFNYLHALGKQSTQMIGVYIGLEPRLRLLDQTSMEVNCLDLNLQEYKSLPHQRVRWSKQGLIITSSFGPHKE